MFYVYLSDLKNHDLIVSEQKYIPNNILCQARHLRKTCKELISVACSSCTLREKNDLKPPGFSRFINRVK